MNNLKFRAWDKINKEMLKIDVIDFFLKGIRVLENKDNSFFIKFSDVEIMQSTGLFDKNGTDIFEGDIVVKYENYFIITQRVSGCWKLLKKEYDGVWYIDLYDICDYVEVVGNIYENKELIENKELLENDR